MLQGESEGYYSSRKYFNFERDIIKKLVSMGEDFTYEHPTKNGIEVKFEMYNNTINGTRVCRDKMLFIVDYLYKNNLRLSEAEILKLNKLPQIKIKMVETKEVYFSRDSKRIDLPITFTYLNEVYFKVNFLEVEKEVRWDTLKNIFYRYSNTEMDKNIKQDDFFKLATEELGLTKQQIFDYLKRMIMLQELKGSEGDKDE
jgi:hypothetical protein